MNFQLVVVASVGIALGVAGVAQGSEDVLSRCCALGSDWARQRSYSGCADFPAPVTSVPGEQLAMCIASADICCRRDNRKIQCKRGTGAAQSNKSCAVNVTEHGEAYKDCCEACKLGMIARALGESCGMRRFAFGLPWDGAFHECCQDADGPPTPTQSNLLTPVLNFTHCDEGTCSHICVPTLGSFRCECHPGFSLMSDRKSCQLQTDQDRCVRNNPCMHRCRDTGLAVECSCNPGYELQKDGKTCSDINECERGNTLCPKSTTCHNFPGGYTCVGREGPVIPVFDAPLDNALPLSAPSSAGLGLCPVGWDWDPKNKVCDDVDECGQGLANCPRPEDCVNTLGSFSCDGLVSCPPGYVRDPAQGCVDKDECDDGSNSCDEDSEFCINQQGGYDCLERTQGRGSCPAGYKKDATHKSGCTDVDECADPNLHVCSNVTEECVNHKGGYRCIRKEGAGPSVAPGPSPVPSRCQTGFIYSLGQKKCVDDDECVRSPCDSNQRCHNTLGSYSCECKDGYVRDPITMACVDVNECQLGLDNCMETQRCDNTIGSFQCIRFSGCGTGYTLNAATGLCEDIDECTVASPCGRGQRCVNTPGSYQCVYRIQCKPGYVPSPEGDRCVDEDECATGSHKCRPGQTCLNRPGSYQCQCPPGHTLDADKKCVDVDECERFPRQACSDLATCENTIGSYRCVCKDGFKQGRGKSCDDIDECAETPNLCQHQCINVWGSYRCSCERGFHLHSDNRSCVDIDECQVHREGRLCVGDCVNTPGSYKCVCPSGYRLGKDGRTCIDIDECSTGRECRRPGEVCLNMQGSFRCNNIRCPEGYQQDFTQKNRCRRVARACPIEDQECRRQPLLMTYNFMSLVSNMNIPPSGQLDLFVMKGSLTSDTHTTFSLELDSARTPHGVPAATSSHFRLTQVKDNQAVVSLVRPLAGPQDVELRLVMEVYSGSYFAGLNVAKLNLFVSQNQF